MSMSGRMAMSEPVRRLEPFTGAGRRRTWSQDEKAAIVSESAASTISISAVARRHGLNVSQLFTWRRLARQEAAGDRRSELRFVPAVLMSEPLEATPVEAKAEPHRRAACTKPNSQLCRPKKKESPAHRPSPRCRRSNRPSWITSAGHHRGDARTVTRSSLCHPETNLPK